MKKTDTTGKKVTKEATKEVAVADVKRKIMIGKVVSTKMKNTVSVSVEHMKKHPLYGKSIRRSKKFLAHNVSLEIKEGDQVKIGSIRPMSKKKFFEVIEKI